ncbi:MAG: hypothetical protein E7541_04990 [Ruminococcaceae bacterium]|nr:hypothetical protein [Oscillospiraceae bacterium]
MTKSPYARKALSLLLSVTLLLSLVTGIVWSGASAATVESLTGRQLAVLDFTTNPKESGGASAYAATGNNNNSYSAGIATAVPTIEAAGGYMTLKYHTNMVAGNGDKYAAFRYFPTQRLSDTTNYVSRGNDDFRTKSGVAYDVTFKYKVISAPVAAELRWQNGGIAWSANGGTNANAGVVDTMDIAAGTVHTTWQTGAFTFVGNSEGGVHMSLMPKNLSACSGLEVQVTDIVISTAANRPQGTTYTTDFTNYGVSSQFDMSKTASTKAEIVDSGDTHGSAMKLSFLGTGGLNQVGFRFFGNTGTATADKVAVAQGTPALVTFDYKVLSLASDAQVRVLSGSWPWTGGVNTNTGSFNTPSEHCAVGGDLAATATAGTWKTASVVVKGACGNAGIHLYLDSATPAAGDAILIDNVKVVVNFAPVVINLDLGYDSRTQTLEGVDDTTVDLPVPTRSGYVFKGWYGNASYTGAAQTSVTFSNATHGTTLYAKWEVNTSATRIAFNTNGGNALDDLAGDPGAAAGQLPTPTKGAYTFAGWYTDVALTVAATNVAFPQSGSITLYAKWEDPQPLAVSPAIGGRLLLRQTFETVSLSDFITITNDKGKFDDVSTDVAYAGNKSLKTTIKDGWNSQRERPRIILQGDDGQKLKVQAGKTYVVSFWVRAPINDDMFAFYVATMGASDADTMIKATSGSCHKLQNITAMVGPNAATIARGNEVDMHPIKADQWTQVAITIPSLVLDDATQDNYLELGFTSNGSQAAYVATWEDTPYYIDNIEVYEAVESATVTFDTNGGDPIAPKDTNDAGVVYLPEPYKFGYTYTGWYTDPACTPASKVTSPYMPAASAVTLYTTWEKALPTGATLVQDFETVDSIESLTTNTARPFVIGTDGTNKVLKTTIKQGFGGNFSRPIWAFQMNGQTAPLQVVTGASATVTFKVKASANTTTVGFMLDTMDDLSEITKNPATSSAANEFRTMQVLGSTSHGTLNSACNEVNNVSVQAGTWTEITVTIPSIKAHGSGAQYLVLAISDPQSGVLNKPWTDYDLMIDDVTITTLMGGHTVNVTYVTNGGDPLAAGTGFAWADIGAEATRKGFSFDGWYLDADCSQLVTQFPAQKEITLYAGWRAEGSEVMTFDVLDNYVPTLYCETDFNQTAVQNYYSNAANMATGHALVDAEGVKVMQNSLDSNYSTVRGFRLVKKDGSQFTTVAGESYEVTFQYRVKSFGQDCKTGTFAVLEGSIPWQAQPNGTVTEYNGTAVTAADLGVWKTASVVFAAEQGDLGLHLGYRATDMTTVQGTVIEYKDIKVQSYQLTDFTLSSGATLDTTHNHTVDGDTAAKVDTSTTGAAIYASGLGEKMFATGTVGSLTGWLYVEADLAATLKVYAVPNLDALDTRTIAGTKELNLKGGQWNRVQFDFGIGGSGYTYLAVGVSATNGTAVWMDDIALGIYPNDNTKLQTYEDKYTGVHPNAAVIDTNLHGYFGNTVVAGNKGYNSDKALQIAMQSAVEMNYSRAVLMPDKMDLMGTVGNGYVVTFMAKVDEDLDVNFGVGSSNTVNIADRDQGALAVETNATATASLKAGQWQAVAVVVNDLQGKTPENVTNPYMTLAAWFEGAADDNVKNVYIDDVRVRDYIQPEVTREDTLCFEDTGAFGYGTNLNLSSEGKMTVSLDQNHSAGGYYSLRVESSSNAGGVRPQFNLVNAYGDAVKVQKGNTYKVSYWVYVGSDQPDTQMRWWLTITNRTDAYTATPEKDAELVYEQAETLSANGWKQITAVVDNVPRDGYLRIGVARFGLGAKQVYYLDDIRVQTYKAFEHTGTEEVENFETYPLGNVDFNRKGTAVVSDEMNHTEYGLNALRLTGMSWAGVDRNQFIITNPATKQPYELIKGDSYTLRFWVYYSSSVVDDFEVNAWILGVDDPKTVLSKKDKCEWDGPIAPVTNDGEMLPDEWNCYEITFTATHGKYLLMGITNGKVMGGGYHFYIDDIEVDKPIPAVVTFDPNGGQFEGMDASLINDKGQYVERTAVGLYTAGPEVDPYRKGYKFYGWATDAKGESQFDILTSSIDAAELTLYAIWGEWDDDDETPDKIDKDNLQDNVEYKTEIKTDRVWTGNAKLPELDFDDNFTLEDADPVTYVPQKDVDKAPVNDGLPVWLIIVIIVAGVVIVGGGAVLALLLLKNKKPNDKEVA